MASTTIINEKTTSIVTLTFTNENDDAVTPDSGSYRIDDVDSGTAIKAATAFTPTSSTHEITISSTENSILNTDNDYEQRVLTVTTTYSGGKVCTAEYFYMVKNLQKIT